MGLNKLHMIWVGFYLLLLNNFPLKNKMFYPKLTIMHGSGTK